MSIEEAKNNLIQVLDTLDKDKLSLQDLKLCAEILKTVSEIQVKSYTESLAEMIGSGFGMGYRSATVSDLK